MQGEIKTIKTNKSRRNKEGAITTPRHAVIQLVVPLDSVSQREALVELMDIIDAEEVFIEIDDNDPQTRMAFHESTEVVEEESDEAAG